MFDDLKYYIGSGPAGKRVESEPAPTFTIDSPDIRKTAEFYVKKFRFEATYHVADKNFTNPHIHLRKKHNIEILLKPWNGGKVYEYDKDYVLHQFRRNMASRRASCMFALNPFCADLFFECDSLEYNVRYLKRLGNSVKVYGSHHIVEDVDGREIAFLERKNKRMLA